MKQCLVNKCLHVKNFNSKRPLFLNHKLEYQSDSVMRFLTSGFFRQSITPWSQMNTLKYFRILFQIRWEINENVLMPRYAA
jgi:hypothetical protein